MERLWSQMYRKFGLCEIQWEIENFSLLSSFKNWEVCSPNFQVRGYKVTGWNLKLRQVTESENNTSVYFQIHMIADETVSQLVTVHCKLSKYNRYGNWDLVKEMEYDGNQFFTLEEPVDQNYFTNRNPFNSESLLLKIELLVYFPAHPELAPRFANVSLQELSEDIYRLYISQLNSDVNLVIGEDNPVHIKSHKAILFARNPKLKKMIQENGMNTYFRIDHYNRSYACDIMLRFLYSANMEMSVIRPSIGVHEIASIYGVHPVVAYFTPDRLSLRSTIHGDAFEVVWTIENFFSTSRTYFKSPKFENETIDASWQVTLYPKSLLNEDYVGLHIDIQGGIQKVIWIQICFRNSQKVINSKIKQGLVTDKSNFIDNMFIERRDLENLFNEENVILTIKFKAVETDPTGTEWIADQRDIVGTSVVECLPYCEQKNFKKFSEDMSNLYESGQFRDMFFQLGTVISNINSGIASVRCEVLYNHVLQGVPINLGITRPQTVLRLISFLNCCEIDNSVILEETFELYDIAVALNLETLRVILLQSLREFSSLGPFHEVTKIHTFALMRDIFDLDVPIDQLRLYHP